MNHKEPDKISNVIQSITESCFLHPMSPSQSKQQLVCREKIIDIINELRNLIFPGYFSNKDVCENDFKNYISTMVLRVKDLLTDQIYLALSYAYRTREKVSAEDSKKKAEDICILFLQSLTGIREVIETDVQAAFDGDPAATDKDIIITSYPGIFAICAYRIAHELYLLDVPYIPRMMTEYAHSKTGIDIHPGAKIGRSFFIDHGTGIVIGETTVIGENVKIYQGVTLGALSTRGGQSLRGAKRHPTIRDNVTIYSGASVLGGETVIENDVVIGGNAFITGSVSLDKSKGRNT